MADSTDDSKQSALDRFAAASRNDPIQAPSVMELPTASERVFGAQRVAVYRDLGRVMNQVKQLAAAAGEHWYYRFPVKNRKENRTDWIEGPSIKLANDLARIYGNCDVDTRVIDLGTHWLFYARFTDFETGFSMTRPFQQRKSQATMGPAGDRQLDIAFQIGTSKAIRNVVTNALQTFADDAFEAARDSLVEKIGADLDKWRARTIQGLANMPEPVPLANAERVVGRSAKDWLAPDVARVIAMMKAVKDGMATIDETFPTPGKQIEPGDDSEAESADQDAARGGAEQAQRNPSQGDSPTRQAKPEAEGERDNAGGKGAAPGAAAEAKATAATAHPDNAPQGQKTPGAADSKTATAKTEPDLPTNEREYVAFAEYNIDRMTDATAGEAAWKAEKVLRNKCHVSPEVRDRLQDRMKAKAATLRS